MKSCLRELNVFMKKDLVKCFAGGAIGLFLGWSVISMFTIVLHLVRQLERRVFEN